MSRWTHITACLSVETGMAQYNKTKLVSLVKKYLATAPKITGSEKTADVFVNVKGGYNWYLGRDCHRCKYKDTITPVGNAEFYCKHPENHKCKSGQYQSGVVISIQGDLRDRVKEETQKEFDDFLDYIKKEYYIRDYSVNIEGE